MCVCVHDCISAEKWTLHTVVVLTLVCVLRCVWLIVTPWTLAHGVPLSMGFSRQEYWNTLTGLPFPTAGDLPNPGDRTCITCISYTGRLVFYQLHHLGSMHMYHRIPNGEKSSDRAWPLTVYIWGNYNLLQLNEIVQWHNDRQKSWGQKLGFLISKLVLFLLLYFIAHCQVGTKNSIQQILTVFPYMPSTGLCSGIQKKCKRRVLPKKNFWAHWENRAHTHTKYTVLHYYVIAGLKQNW